MDVGGQGHALASLPAGKRPSTHYTGGWVVPRAGLDGWIFGPKLFKILWETSGVKLAPEGAACY
jgi:hypothetical protein